jgi:hypothetical protein
MTTSNNPQLPAIPPEAPAAAAPAIPKTGAQRQAERRARKKAEAEAARAAMTPEQLQAEDDAKAARRAVTLEIQRNQGKKGGEEEKDRAFKEEDRLRRIGEVINDNYPWPENRPGARDWDNRYEEVARNRALTAALTDNQSPTGRIADVKNEATLQEIIRAVRDNPNSDKSTIKSMNDMLNSNVYGSKAAIGRLSKDLLAKYPGIFDPKQVAEAGSKRAQEFLDKHTEELTDEKGNTVREFKKDLLEAADKIKANDRDVGFRLGEPFGTQGHSPVHTEALSVLENTRTKRSEPAIAFGLALARMNGDKGEEENIKRLESTYKYAESIGKDVHHKYEQNLSNARKHNTGQSDVAIQYNNNADFTRFHDEEPIGNNAAKIMAQSLATSAGFEVSKDKAHVAEVNYYDQVRHTPEADQLIQQIASNPDWAVANLKQIQGFFFGRDDKKISNPIKMLDGLVEDARLRSEGYNPESTSSYIVNQDGPTNVIQHKRGLKGKPEIGGYDVPTTVYEEAKTRDPELIRLANEAGITDFRSFFKEGAGKSPYDITKDGLETAIAKKFIQTGDEFEPDPTKSKSSNDLRKRNWDAWQLKKKKFAASEMASRMLNLVYEVMPEVKDWHELTDSLVDAAEEAGVKNIKLTTPTGARVEPDKPRTSKVYGVEGKQVDVRRNEKGQSFDELKSTLAPTKIHALDSSAQALMLNGLKKRGINQIVSKHDEFGSSIGAADAVQEEFGRAMDQLYETDPRGGGKALHHYVDQYRDMINKSQAPNKQELISKIDKALANFLHDAGTGGWNPKGRPALSRAEGGLV